VEELGDELLVYDLNTDEAHSLDPSAAAIWRACDANSTAPGIAARTGQSETAVRTTLERLAELDLLAAGSFAADTHSRRAVLRRGLLAGAAGVAAVPLIRSIVTPPAAHAQSGCVADQENNTPCTQTCQCIEGCCCNIPVGNPTFPGGGVLCYSISDCVDSIAGGATCLP
jgi:hypothetical protein